MMSMNIQRIGNISIDVTEHDQHPHKYRYVCVGCTVWDTTDQHHGPRSFVQEV